MKSLIVAIFLAVSSFTSNAVADNSNSISKFAYNYEMNGDQMISEIVYKVENEKFLHPHLKYCYSYDSTGRLAQKEVLKWNPETKEFEKLHCLRFAYSDTDVTVELISWNAKQQTYSTVKAKSIYQLSDENTVANYLNYKWNEREKDWNLVIQHNTYIANTYTFKKSIICKFHKLHKFCSLEARSYGMFVWRSNKKPVPLFMFKKPPEIKV